MKGDDRIERGARTAGAHVGLVMEEAYLWIYSGGLSHPRSKHLSCLPKAGCPGKGTGGDHQESSAVDPHIAAITKFSPLVPLSARGLTVHPLDRVLRHLR